MTNAPNQDDADGTHPRFTPSHRRSSPVPENQRTEIMLRMIALEGGAARKVPLRTGIATTIEPVEPVSPLTIALGYAALASGWILVTDLLVGSMVDSAAAHIVKGLFFVLGTAFALFLLLRRLTARETAQRRNLDTMVRAYRLLFEGHPLPSWVCDPDSGRILAANAAASTLHDEDTDMTGRSLAQLLGRDPDDDSTLVQSRGRGAERAFKLLSVPCTFADRPALLYLAQELTEERMALARAFYREAPIIVLDEPTSFMDTWAENEWLKDFRRLVENKSVLVVTHRLAMARQADLIYVMADGELVESGSHEELLRENGRYAESWNSQIGSTQTQDLTD